MNSLPPATLLLSALPAVLLLTAGLPCSAAPIPEDVKIGGFAVGCQAWTFNRFTVFDAIEKTADTGAKVIELFPGQKLSPAEADIKVDHNSPDDVLNKVKEKLAKHQVRAVNYGVVNASGEAEWRAIFDFARKLGLYGITTEAVPELDTIEKLVKEYDICVAIHNHPRRADDPNYKVWDPAYVLSVVRNRDPRIGSCADTGHWATSGVNPLEALKILRGRVISSHLKDRSQIGQSTTDLVFGAGVLKIGTLLDELNAQKFKGNISLEFETNWENNVPDVAQCIGFFRGYGSCIR